jgi:uncharacterized protein YuzE
MKVGKKGAMNLDFSETYDQEDDTYYVTFKTGEPSYCIEVDDVLLLEVGMFTNLPTGFRILNFHKNHVTPVELKALSKKVKKTLEESRKSLPTIYERESRVNSALEKVLA